MTVATTDRLIAPHGGLLVDRTGERPDDLDSLERVELTSRELSDLDMIASGALSPLEGFMGRADYERVLEEMHLANGLPWALPVCLAVESAPAGDRVALADESGRPVAVDRGRGGLRVRQGARGRAQLPHDRRRAPRRRAALRPEAALPRRSRDRVRAGAARSSRSSRATRPRRGAIFAERGWKRVVGFQTRNPIHRAHEYLTKVALETVDGLLVHPLVGETKADDVPVGRSRRLLQRAAGGLLPAGPRAPLRLPGRDALRGAARGDLACHLPQELRLLALHRGPRPRRSRRLLRHLRRPAHLRRVQRRTSSTSSRCSSSTRSGATCAGRWRARSRARTARRTGSSSRGRRSARCSAKARCRPWSSRGPRSRGC